VAEEPLRTQTAMVFRGGLKNESGTLLLFPDRLSHVASAGMAAGALGGVAGMLVVGKLAKNKAGDKEAQGGKGVTTIPFAEVTEIRKGRQGLNKSLLEVEAAGGTVLKLGVKFDQWKPDLVEALRAAGRSVHDGGDVVTVS
jgi:predicted RecA/RadA family phage recombinase